MKLRPRTRMGSQTLSDVSNAATIQPNLDIIVPQAIYEGEFSWTLDSYSTN